MNQKQIRKMIEDVEKLLEKTEVNIVTAEFYDKLLCIHASLWEFLYFKVNQEKDYLKVKKKK